MEERYGREKWWEYLLRLVLFTPSLHGFEEEIEVLSSFTMQFAFNVIKYLWADAPSSIPGSSTPLDGIFHLFYLIELLKCDI